MPEHVNIDDPEIHEPKGASSAAADQLLQAIGDGTTEWVNPSSVLALAQLDVENVLASESTAVSQEPSSVDTVKQVEFGPSLNGATDDAQLLVDGTVQFNTAGLYLVTSAVQIGKPSGGSGESIFLMRNLLNGAALNGSTAEHVNPNALTRHRVVHLGFFEVSDLYTIEFYIDSAGAGSAGGLYRTVPTIGSWANSPSAYISVQRLMLE